jgi:NADH-quinone oxidoreductase subunit A
VDGYAGAWGTVAVLLLVGVAFVVVALGANRLLSPAGRRGGASVEPYECGVTIDPIDRQWAQTHIRYYVYAFIYVIFAVEAVFLYPWATILTKPGFGGGALAEMGVFVGLLALGLLYAWRKRVLTWD